MIIEVEYFKNFDEIKLVFLIYDYLFFPCVIQIVTEVWRIVDSGWSHIEIRVLRTSADVQHTVRPFASLPQCYGYSFEAIRTRTMTRSRWRAGNESSKVTAVLLGIRSVFSYANECVAEQTNRLIRRWADSGVCFSCNYSTLISGINTWK